MPQALNAQGKFAQAQPLYEKALEIRRRLLTDHHPDTAVSYNSVAFNLNTQGKFAQAKPLCEKALEINRRLLTDDHPDTAISYNNVAFNLSAQGKYVEARDQWLRAVKSLDSARLRVAFTGLELRRGVQGAGSSRPGRRARPARSAGRGMAVAGGGPGTRPARRAGRPSGPAAHTRAASPPSRVNSRPGTARQTGRNHAEGPRQSRAGGAVCGPEAPARWRASPWVSSRPSLSGLTARWLARSPG